jgi:uridine kinase
MVAEDGKGLRVPAEVRRSVSTWQQPLPRPASPQRTALVERLASVVDGLGTGRLRVAVDGLTAAGKTSFGHELGEAMAGTGRPVLRASLDDFKRPWSERHRYDRFSGEGYYRNAFDLDAVVRLLLEPVQRKALCAIDPLTQVDHSAETVEVPADAVLVVDGVFAFRPPLDPFWDLRIWLDVDEETSIRRGEARDGEAGSLHRDRYLPAERIYIAECDPVARADVVVDNTDFAVPRLVRAAVASDP